MIRVRTIPFLALAGLLAVARRPHEIGACMALVPLAAAWPAARRAASTNAIETLRSA